MRVKEKLTRSLSVSGPMCDDCLTEAVAFKQRQTTNQYCRKFENTGVLTRGMQYCPVCGRLKIVNTLSGEGKNPTAQRANPSAGSGTRKHNVERLETSAKNHDVEALSEDEIKKVLETWLKKRGWTSDIAWGRTPGIDIDARKNNKRWIIEVKGPGSRPPMRVNYFIGILGETLQRMQDPRAKYSVAFPEVPQFRRLWDRLPKLAKSRTGISAIFVSKEGEVVLLDDDVA